MTATIWDVVEDVRQTFERAGYPRLRRTHVVVAMSIDAWDAGKRTVAATSADGLRMWLSPRLETFDEERQYALLAHEFGHAVQGLYGTKTRSTDASEREADAIAEKVMGAPLYYASVDGRLIQTFRPRGGVRPRPLGLR